MFTVDVKQQYNNNIPVKIFGIKANALLDTGSTISVISPRLFDKIPSHLKPGGGRVVRRCWVNFQCQGVLLTWLTVGQGPIVLSVGAGGGCLDIFSLIYHFFFLSPSLWETARYRLKYCLKGPLSPKQPTISSLKFLPQTAIYAWLTVTHPPHRVELCCN